MIDTDEIKKVIEKNIPDSNEYKSISHMKNINYTPLNDYDSFNWCLKEFQIKNSFVKGNRNAFITALSNFCNEYGVSYDYCLSECLKRFIETDFNANEIESTIKSVYNNKLSNHGTKKYERKPEFIQQKYQVPSNIGKINIPEFPTEVFPEKVQSIIYELHDKLQFHHDLISAGIISACSTAIGNSFELSHNNHINKTIVWCVSVAEKGKGKSEPQKWCKKPFHDIDFRNKKEYDKIEKQWNDYNELKQTEKANYESENGKPEKPKSARHFQYILGDYNPETLYRVHNINQRGIMIFSDELMKWINSFDRYSKGGEQQFLNELWNGTTANYDRVTKSIFIENSFVDVLGTIQTQFLKSLSANNRTIDGFLERLLYFFPDIFLKPKPNGKSLSENVYNEYNQILDKLLSCQFGFWEDGQIKPQRIYLEQEAGTKFNQWLNNYIDKQNNTSNENEKAILAKLEIYCYRFSLLLQLIFWASGESDNSKVELFAVEGAIKMVNYFHQTAMKVYSTIECGCSREITEKEVLLYLRKKTGKEYKDILNFSNSNIKESTFRSWLNRNK